jgi:hypothetical protein
LIAKYLQSGVELGPQFQVQQLQTEILPKLGWLLLGSCTCYFQWYFLPMTVPERRLTKVERLAGARELEERECVG